MSNTNTSIMHTIGSITGKAGAYAWEGSRLASSQFAAGAVAGYSAKAEQLRAARLALPAARPAAQRKLSTAKA